MDLSSNNPDNSDTTIPGNLEEPSIVNPHRLTYKVRRTEVRTATRINATTLHSLQSLSGQDNLCRINALIDSTKSETRCQKLLGLCAVLEELLAPVFTKYSTTNHKQSLPSGVILLTGHLSYLALMETVSQSKSSVMKFWAQKPG